MQADNLRRPAEGPAEIASDCSLYAKTFLPSADARVSSSRTVSKHTPSPGRPLQETEEPRGARRHATESKHDQDTGDLDRVREPEDLCFAFTWIQLESGLPILVEAKEPLAAAGQACRPLSATSLTIIANASVVIAK